MNKLRKWINRDNGKHYQIGNLNLCYLEILGYLLLISTFIVTALIKKELVSIPLWLTIFPLATSAILLRIGEDKSLEEKK